ncbi:MAG: hypothetical protein KC496_01925 [Anaerolineae bacterium]|nr:hypothetical protein [Anaerolineae bacterium]
MKLRVLFVTALVLLMASLAVVSAQDFDPCLGLAAEDCATINEAYANLDGVNSFSFEYSIDFSVSGIPESAGLGSSEVTFSNTGNGYMALNMEAMDTATIPANISMTMTSSWSGFGPDMEDASDVLNEFMVIDNMIYLGDGTGMWLSIDPAESADMGAATLGFDPTALAGDPAAMDDALGMASGFMPLLNVPGFLAYTRDGDVYTFNADITALISSPEFMQAMSSLSESEDPNMQQAAMIVSILPMVFQEANITVTQNVNPDMNVVDGVGFTLNATVDGSLLDPEISDPIVNSLDFNVNIADANGEFEFVVPENVTPLDQMGMGS